MTIRRMFLLGLALGLAPAARGQDQDDTPHEAPTAFVPGMVVAPTALPPLGLREPDGIVLARPDVQADLKLNPEQRRKLAPVDQRRVEGQRELDEMADITNQNVYAPLPVRDINSLASMQADFNQDIQDATTRILTRQQRVRFAQIRLQLDGPMAFTRPELLEKLDIDDDQAATIRDILDEAREEMVNNAQFPLTTRDVPRRDGPKPPLPEAAFQEKLAQARLANDRMLQVAFGRIAGVLRKSQWDQYLKLRGVPFVAFDKRSAPVPGPPGVPAPSDARRPGARRGPLR
jgi:hypothetical protein